jgi:hypothetical protein
MSPRKRAQTPDRPSLPTIKDYFGKMAQEQRDDILRLKRAAAGKNSGPLDKPPAETPVPHPWLLHPVRLTGTSAVKSGARTDTRSAAKATRQKPAKKLAKKVSKKSK